MLRGVKRRDDGKWKRMVIFAALFFIFLILLNSVKNVYQKKKEADRTLAQMQKEFAELERRSKYLKDTLARLETEEGIKFEIKKKLNVAEVGESVAIIVEEGSDASSSGVPKSLWQKTKDFFKGLFE